MCQYVSQYSIITLQSECGFDLGLCFFLLVLSNGFWWRHAHLCRFEGLQATPHGPLEDLLHLIVIPVDVKVTATVSVPVLYIQEKRKKNVVRVERGPERMIVTYRRSIK